MTHAIMGFTSEEVSKEVSFVLRPEPYFMSTPSNNGAFQLSPPSPPKLKVISHLCRSVCNPSFSIKSEGIHNNKSMRTQPFNCRMRASHAHPPS